MYVPSLNDRLTNPESKYYIDGRSEEVPLWDFILFDGSRQGRVVKERNKDGKVVEGGKGGGLLRHLDGPENVELHFCKAPRRGLGGGRFHSTRFLI